MPKSHEKIKLNSSNWILLIIAVLFSISFTLLYYFVIYIEDVQRISASVTVDQHPGVNLTSESLNFGSMTEGMCSERILSIENTKQKPAKIQIRIAGKLAPWIIVSNSSMILQPDEKYQVKFSVCIPKGAVDGTHTGSVYILVKR